MAKKFTKRAKKQKNNSRSGLIDNVLLVFFIISSLVIIYGLMSSGRKKEKELSLKNDNESVYTKTVPTETPVNSKAKNNYAVVLNNDSYWKIAKRVCGNGRLYLSIRDQNNGKALYKGEKVAVNCAL